MRLRMESKKKRNRMPFVYSALVSVRKKSCLSLSRQKQKQKQKKLSKKIVSRSVFYFTHSLTHTCSLLLPPVTRSRRCALLVAFCLIPSHSRSRSRSLALTLRECYCFEYAIYGEKTFAHIWTVTVAKSFWLRLWCKPDMTICTVIWVSEWVHGQCTSEFNSRLTKTNHKLNITTL